MEEEPTDRGINGLLCAVIETFNLGFPGVHNCRWYCGSSLFMCSCMRFSWYVPGSGNYYIMECGHTCAHEDLVN